MTLEQFSELHMDTPRVTRLLTAAAALTTSGHCREDAVRTAIKLEEQVISALYEIKTQDFRKEKNSGDSNNG
jgi:hypothetical protein